MQTCAFKNAGRGGAPAEKKLTDDWRRAAVCWFVCRRGRCEGTTCSVAATAAEKDQKEEETDRGRGKEAGGMLEVLSSLSSEVAKFTLSPLSVSEKRALAAGHSPSPAKVLH